MCVNSEIYSVFLLRDVLCCEVSGHDVTVKLRVQFMFLIGKRKSDVRTTVRFVPCLLVCHFNRDINVGLVKHQTLD